MIESRYKGYDVMVHREEWDEHTRHIIDKRMGEAQPPQFFTLDEAAALRCAVSRLLCEDDPWIIDKVLEHIDGTLAHGTGEGFRPEWQPPEAEFWHGGVALLGDDYAGQPPEWQDERLRYLQENYKEFFKALHKEAVTAYCSLPPVWSFMGYGGPAFPRGYVRTELEMLDPWEANRDGK